MHYGLGIAPFDHGGAWELIIVFATAAFVAWALREVEICKKLEMGFHVPIMFSFAVSAFVVLQIVRPAAHGLLVRRIRYRIHRPPHVGVQHGLPVHDFYLNPFHAYAVLGFFLTAMVLAMHGARS